MPVAIVFSSALVAFRLSPDCDLGILAGNNMCAPAVGLLM
jgi:hypothetical protein